MKQIGGVETYETTRGIEYAATFLCSKSEAAPSIGAVASWAPEYATITEVAKVPLVDDNGDRKIVLRAGRASADLPLIDKNNLEEQWDRKMIAVDFYMPMEWWGVYEASFFHTRYKYLNTKGAACAEGDYMFRDASETSKGAEDISKSPFNSSYFLDPKFIEQTIKLDAMIINYYVKKSLNSVSEFRGVSGAMPKDFQPPNFAAGRWLAKGRQERFETKNSKGDIYTRVTRTIVKAPSATTRWDPDKNGGTWTW